MLTALVVGRKNRASEENAFGGFGLHRTLAFECSETRGLALALSPLLLFECLKTGQCLPAGCVGGRGLALSLLSPQAGLALRGVTLSAKTRKFLRGTLGVGFGATTHRFGLGLLRLQLGEDTGRFLCLQASLLRREAMCLGLGFGALTGLGFTPGQLCAFGFRALRSEGIFRPGPVCAVTKDPGDQKENG